MRDAFAFLSLTSRGDPRRLRRMELAHRFFRCNRILFFRQGNSMTGRTSTVPLLAMGISRATAIASSRFLASMRK